MFSTALLMAYGSWTMCLRNSSLSVTNRAELRQNAFQRLANRRYLNEAFRSLMVHLL